jgi:hypothetical protein
MNELPLAPIFIIYINSVFSSDNHENYRVLTDIGNLLRQSKGSSPLTLGGSGWNRTEMTPI